MCEYCGADMPSVDLRKVLRQLSAASAAIGIVILLYACGEPRPAVVSADDLCPSMNHALVSVRGRIASKPFVKTTAEGVSYASILIDDGSGLIRASLQSDDASLFAARRPSEGDMFEAVGVLQVQAGRKPRIFIRRIKGEVSWKLSP